MARKKSSKLKSHTSRRAWEMIRRGIDYKTIGEELGYTSTAIKLFARKKYKNESEKLWANEIKKVGECEIPDCHVTDNLEALHLLEKYVWTHLARDLTNGACLCSGHHKFNVEISPHTNLPAKEAFLNWLKVFRNGVWLWYEEHKDDKKYQELDYEQIYYELKEIK